jgi:PAS domain S-box-containing protein
MDDVANLLQSNHFAGTLIDSLPCGFVVLDEDGRVQAMNNIMERVLGITRKTAVGKKQGEVLRCIHIFESTAGCGCTQDCPDCET